MTIYIAILPEIAAYLLMYAALVALCPKATVTTTRPCGSAGD
jgi:hypothetical protein